MNNRKSTMRSRRPARHVPGRHQVATPGIESPIAEQLPVYTEKNSLLFTQILSGLVWNG